MNKAPHFDLLIAGTSRPGSGNETIPVHSPADGSWVGTVSKATEIDVASAVSAAQPAFSAWSGLTAYERDRIIRKATAHVRTRTEEIARLMTLEQGKPLAQARSEVTGACDTIDFYAAEGLRVEGYTSPTEDRSYRSTVIYQPVGICALIIPWNYPLSLLSWKLGPALASGCVAIVKPTTVTPMSPTAFCSAMVEGGIPPGVISVLNGPGATLGEALVRHPQVSKIAMTGSTATGKRLMAIAGPALKKISLELGGHCPAIVCADADIDLAAKIIAYKGFRNMGQSCSSVNRVYVHQSVHDLLAAKLETIAKKMTIGDGLTDPQVDLGPMTTRDGLETVRSHVLDALEKGAKLVCGGKPPDHDHYARGNYYLPTVLSGVTREMRVMFEETFGPVVPLVSFENLDEAVAAANDSNYGLAAYLFTRDYSTTIRVSEALQTGTVCVNHGAVNTNYGPYSGWKESGFGLELSRQAIFEYLKVKHIKVALT